MKKIARNEPVCIGKALSFDQMIAEVKQKGEEKNAFYQKTGLCINCRSNKADISMVCSECKQKTEEILKQLRGTSGFMEVKI